MRKINRIIRYLIIISCCCLGFGTRSAAAEIEERERLGGMTHYNAFIFDYFESIGGAMEGALAVGGTGKMGTSSGQYDVGASAYHAFVGTYENPERYPSLLLNEKPQIGSPHYSNVNIYGGPVVMNEKLKSFYEASPEKFKVAEVLYGDNKMVSAYFDDAYETVKHMEYVLDNAYSKESRSGAQIALKDFVGWNTKPGVFDNMSKFRPDNLVSDNNLQVLMLEVTDSGHIEINGPQLTGAFGDYDVVVLRFPNVTSARFTGASVSVDGTQLHTSSVIGTEENKLLKKYAEKVIWDFPGAETIQLAGTGVVGSVLSPEAYISGSGGSINGMVIAESLYIGGGLSLNSFSLEESIFDLNNKEEGREATGSVELIKYDRNTLRTTARGAIRLGDAAFDLYREENGTYKKYNAKPLITGWEGTIYVEDLPLGNYYFQETEAPYGYYLSDDEHHFQVTMKQGIESPVRLLIDNKKITTSVQLKKVNAENTDVGLSGGKFVLYDIGSRTIEIVGEFESGENGEINLNDLGYGSYRLIEIEAPENFESQWEEYVDILIDGDQRGNTTINYRDKEGNIISPAGGQVLMLKNMPLRGEISKRVVITKLDVDDLDTPLEGAVFSLEQWSDYEERWTKVYEKLETDEYGHIFIERLDEGEYRLTELEPPIGYKLPEEQTYFRIDAVSPRDVGYLSHTKYLELYNQAQGQIIVEKTDITDEETKVQGAEFSLYYYFDNPGTEEDSRWEEIAAGETDINGELIFDNLKPGRYGVIQTKVPEGYQQPESSQNIGFTIIGYIYDEEGNKVTYPLEEKFEVKAVPELVAVKFQKIDGETYEQQNKIIGLDGAEFALYKYETEIHQWVMHTTRLTSGADREKGLFTADALIYGEYKLVETKAPKGYQLSEEFHLNEIIFAVTGEETEEAILINDYPLESFVGEAAVMKIDEELEIGLEGAVFKLEKRIPEENMYHEYRNHLRSDENGILILEDLAEGEYLLTEMAAPEGYEITNEASISFEVYDGMEDAEFIITNRAVVLETGESESQSGNEPAVSTGDSTTLSIWLLGLLLSVVFLVKRKKI